MSVFVDTSAWYALLDRSDKSHELIASRLPEVGPLVTTDHVLVETHRLVSFRLGSTAADTFWRQITDGAAQVEIVGLADLDQGLAIRSEWTDQDFSLVDCTSFATMRRLRITDAIALDTDFAVYRYGNRRQHAFRIL